MFGAVGSQTTCRCLSSVTFRWCGWLPCLQQQVVSRLVVSVMVRFCDSQNLLLVEDQGVDRH